MGKDGGNDGDYSAFFYGTLMAPAVLNRVLYSTSQPPSDKKGLLTIKPATLHDFVRRRVRFADYPGVVPEKGQSVLGTFVTGLSAGNIARLDIFEGSQYTRNKVRVKLLTKIGDAQGHGNEEGEEVEAETYEFTDSASYLENGEWDFERFKKEKMHRWADTSDEYAEVDDAFNEGLDGDESHDPTGGRGMNTDMSRKLEGGDSHL